MGFSVLSWNVEHFQGGAARLAKVAQHIRSQNPDIFGLLEVEKLDVLSLMQGEFSDYTFGITDGPQSMEILVGWRTSKFAQAIFTQKRDFKVFNPKLRPGALLSVKEGGTNFNILFLHTDSGTDAAAFGNRFEMFEKILSMKKALDSIANGASNLIVLGDLNTMGLFYPTRAQSNERVPPATEIQNLDKQAGKRAMSMLPKNEALTFNNGTLTSDLDHVLASDQLAFASQGNDALGGTAFVSVRGWINLASAARTQFIDQISDHCSMFVEVT